MSTNEGRLGFHQLGVPFSNISVVTCFFGGSHTTIGTKRKSKTENTPKKKLYKFDLVTFDVVVVVPTILGAVIE